MVQPGRRASGLVQLDNAEEIQHFEHQLNRGEGQTEKNAQAYHLGATGGKGQVLPVASRAKTADGHGAAPRCLLQDLFVMEADILPDPQNKLIHVHGASRPAANRALAQLFSQLNEAHVQYPGTDLRLVYELRAGEVWKAPEVSS